MSAAIRQSEIYRFCDNARAACRRYSPESSFSVAVAADQVFMEIPARRLQRALDHRPLVERVGVLALDRDLFGERKGDVIFPMRGLADVAGAARLLAAEVVGRHGEHDQPLVAVARP